MLSFMLTHWLQMRPLVMGTAGTCRGVTVVLQTKINGLASYVMLKVIVTVLSCDVQTVCDAVSQQCMYECSHARF